MSLTPSSASLAARAAAPRATPPRRRQRRRPARAATPDPARRASRRAEAVEPQGFTYNPDGRRDPFVSLLRRGVDTRGAGDDRRPRRARHLGSQPARHVTSEGAFVGILQGVDKKTYIVRVGDKLSDGTIRSITADSMVILQQVNDPLSLEKEREVRKLLRQTEEAKE